MDFLLRRGASDEHTLQGSVRNEQRRLSEKDMPPGGLRRFWVLDFVAPRSQPAGGIPLTELIADYSALKLTARELRGGAIIFLAPR